MRRCMVKGTKDTPHYNALFHAWSFESQLVDPSPLVGGHPGGVVSGTFGIVENEHTGCVSLIHPSRIVFLEGEKDANS